MTAIPITDPSPAAQADLSRVPVLPGLSAAAYVDLCRRDHPRLHNLLRPARLPADAMLRLYADMGALSTHFESKLLNGRGDSYRAAQNQSFLIRSTGFLRIFDLAVEGAGDALPGWCVLDALGGNGTLTRIVRACRDAASVPLIVTSDVSAGMIESALGQGLPAVRQPLENLAWFDDCTFDAVIVAYGTHHIPPETRLQAISEAYRVLKPGGRIVLQDFEVGCPTTRWYEDVLDRYTLTGHRFEYFTRAGFHELLTRNAFGDVRVFDVYDPLILHADDAEEAKRQLCQYVYTLFALEKLPGADGAPDERFWRALEAVVRDTSTFDPAQLPAEANGVSEFTVVRDGSRWRAEIPRVCLVATARRPRTASGNTFPTPSAIGARPC